MPPPAPPPPEQTPVAVRQHLAIGVIAVATVLGLLYVGREVIVPITLALILSLVVGPAVRRLRRLGLSQVPSVLLACGALAAFLLGATALLGLQVVHIAQSLPQYESTIEDKLDTLRVATLGQFRELQGVTTRLGQSQDDAAPRDLLQRGRPGPVPVVVQPRAPNAFELAGRVLAKAWVPFQTAGIVLVVLVFVLLDHEALRDRFIRVAGGPDLRATTAAIDDAGERLSRFFVSQFSLNFATGLVVWAGLWAIGFPHAGLWGALTFVMRFVPYVGVASAALSAALLAAAVEPGWTLLFMTLGLFAAVELIVAQWVEPQLFGHATGLSPLSVVIAAIFWSWLWGPIGLIVSTPLTLCLVVAGRHVRALGFLDVLLGDAPALTLPQRFYQRALAGDADEIIAAAREYLKRKSFAAYCDQVLMRALQLTRADMIAGTITPEQQARVRGVVVRVIEALGSDSGARRRRWLHRSLLDGDAEARPGLQLRQQREAVAGRWQGPLAAPVGSVALCFGIDAAEHELITEILVRVLRDLHIDARHFARDELPPEPPPGTTPESLAMVCLVGLGGRAQAEAVAAAEAALRRRFPSTCLMTLLLPVGAPEPAATPVPALAGGADVTATSFEGAAQHAIARIQGAPAAAAQ